MRVLIIRHGEPDYAVDSLTEKGWREAGLLGDVAAGLIAADQRAERIARAATAASAE